MDGMVDPARVDIDANSIPRKTACEAKLYIAALPEFETDSRRRRQILVTSGKTASAADANAVALARHFADQPDTSLADAAWTLETGRPPLAFRRFAVAKDVSEAVAGLNTAHERAAAKQPCVPGRRVAFLFGGAGLQHIDMGRGLYETEAVFRTHVDHALALAARIGLPDLRRWLFPTDNERDEAARERERPSLGLPALFIVQTALARLWMSLGIQPSAMIGQSCGEYAAAHVSGVIDLEAGLRMAHVSGHFYETAGDGGMLSVPLGEAELTALLPPELTIATVNAPGLCAISGPAPAIAAFQDLLAGREITAQRIPLAGVTHSPMLDPFLPKFRALLKTIAFAAPKIPFASNLTGAWIKPGEATDPEYWVRHLREPVRFVDGLQCLLDDPERILLEVGPGRSMGSLARQHPAHKPTQPVVNSLRHPEQQVEDDARFLEALGELWSHGAPIDWKAFWGAERRRKVPLPDHGHDRLDPATIPREPDATTRNAIAARNAIADWGYEPVWVRADAPAAAPLAGPALVLCDSSGFGRDLAARLGESGVDVVTVAAAKRCGGAGGDFTVRPGERADWAWLFDWLASEGRLPAQVYHCWLATGTPRKRPEPERVLELGFYSLVAMAPELARSCGGNRVAIALVTDGAQRIGADHDLEPTKATALGAARVVGAEYPTLSLRAIDIDRDDPSGTLADAVIAELAAGGGKNEHRDIALRAGERWALDLRPAHSPLDGNARGTPWLRPGGAYIVTGGLGGLGLTVARHLAENGAARIVLTSRTPLPPKSAWADLLAKGELTLAVEQTLHKLIALEATGVEVQLVVADVTDERAVDQALGRIVQRFGPIAGVFHTAGTIDDGPIETRTRAATEAVLRPKVAGTLALERALETSPPGFLMLFSSVSAFAGIPGQADYAAANAFLDAYAEARRGDPATKVISIGWSQWAEVGMAAALEQRVGARSAMLDDLGRGRPIDHPFLERIHSISKDEFVVTGVLSPQRHWLLDEHRVGVAGALLPGAGYLELARAAVAAVASGPAEFINFAFLKPFAVPDGAERALRVHLRRSSDGGWRVTILGRPTGDGPGEWIEHANGVVRERAVPPVHPTLDIDAIGARCRTDAGPARNYPKLRLGPRWRVVTQTLLGRDEALLRLELPAGFHDDLDRVGLHPALLDFATAGALALIRDRDPSRDFHAPFTCRRLVVHAPMPPQVIGHVRYRPGATGSGQTAVFNVTIADPDGLVLAEITDFAMLRTEDAGLLSDVDAPSATPHPPEDSRPEDIHPEEGAQVISRLLAGTSQSRLVISPCPLDAMLARRAPPPVAKSAPPGDDSANLPATETEQLIAGLWRDLLGISTVGRDDNFFDLGGHSLLAVQFANRLHKQTGRTLPLSAMLGNPTLASLARIVDPGGGAVEAGAALPQKIVTIREGGPSTPLVFIHDGLGETLLYRGLALRLDPARPVFGIEPLRTADGNFAHTRIDEMAADYIERLRTVQPSGPYLLTGLCAGAVIAFEVARQLQDMGEHVAFVGILEAADAEARKLRFHDTRIRLERVRALLAKGDLVRLVPALCRKAWNLIRWEVESRIRLAQDKRKVRLIREGGAAAPPQKQQGAPASSIPFIKLYEVALREHRPRGIFEGGTVALFKASDDTGLPNDTPYGMIYRDYALGWGKRVRDDLLIVHVPGGHSSSLQEPYVETLAPLFQSALDSALVGIYPLYGDEAADETPELMEVAAE